MSKNDPRKALGKGLHSLLPVRSTPLSAPAPAPLPVTVPITPEVVAGNVQLLPIEQLKPNPDQPRRDFDQEALLELAQSIERDVIIQPLIERKTGPA
jgi:ParB family transcriptional regulator, chromosome partitioning protein